MDKSFIEAVTISCFEYNYKKKERKERKERKGQQGRKIKDVIRKNIQNTLKCFKSDYDI